MLIADYRPGDEFGPRTLTNYELVWVLAGSARHIWSRPRPGDDDHAEVETGTTPLRPGRLVLVTPGTRDAFEWDRQRATRHAYIHFTITDRGQLPPTWQWPMSRDLLAAPILGGICDYLIELAGFGTEAARRRSDELITLLVDLYVSGPLAAVEPALPPQVAAAVDRVRSTWTTDGMRIVPVEELCAAIGVSAGHLHRVFRDHYGTGPARCFELIRLARGAIALQRSNAGLAEVARLVGFTNPYHFSRRFRQAYGCPPGRYRHEPDPMDPLEPLRVGGLLPLAGRLLSL